MRDPRIHWAIVMRPREPGKPGLRVGLVILIPIEALDWLGVRCLGIVRLAAAVRHRVCNA